VTTRYTKQNIRYDVTQLTSPSERCINSGGYCRSSLKQKDRIFSNDKELFYVSMLHSANGQL